MNRTIAEDPSVIEGRKNAAYFERAVGIKPTNLGLLDVLVKAYSKARDEEGIIRTEKRIAVAKFRIGKVSDAMFAYMDLLHRYPNDEEIAEGMKILMNGSEERDPRKITILREVSNAESQVVFELRIPNEKFWDFIHEFGNAFSIPTGRHAFLGQPIRALDVYSPDKENLTFTLAKLSLAIDETPKFRFFLEEANKF